MSKSIYKEAIKVIKYLQEQGLHQIDTTGTIYITPNNITTLENLLIYSHKLEKLLELYRELITVKDEVIIPALINKNYNNHMEVRAIDLEIQIDELETQIEGLENEKEDNNDL